MIFPNYSETSLWLIRVAKSDNPETEKQEGQDRLKSLRAMLNQSAGAAAAKEPAIE